MVGQDSGIFKSCNLVDRTIESLRNQPHRLELVSKCQDLSTLTSIDSGPTPTLILPSLLLRPNKSLSRLYPCMVSSSPRNGKVSGSGQLRSLDLNSLLHTLRNFS